MLNMMLYIIHFISGFDFFFWLGLLSYCHFSTFGETDRKCVDDDDDMLLYRCRSDIRECLSTVDTICIYVHRYTTQGHIVVTPIIASRGAAEPAAAATTNSKAEGYSDSVTERERERGHIQNIIVKSQHRHIIFVILFSHSIAHISSNLQ